MNLEVEAKIATDKAGHEGAERWLGDRFGPSSGWRTYEKTQQYFDTSCGALTRSDASFRKRAGSYAYCLKVPVEQRGNVHARMEFFHEDDRPLDLFDPFDRHHRILRRLFAIIGDAPPQKSAKFDFAPRVKMEMTRRCSRFALPNSMEWLGCIFLDVCVASAIDQPARRVTWREIEIEALTNNLDRCERLSDLSEELRREIGGDPLPVGKYSHASSLLGISGK